MSRKIIIDCDNTFGLDDCDVDDGLAIIYAIGSRKCEILGITTTFGNNSVEAVYTNTLEFMKKINCNDIPVFKGEDTDYKKNKSAKFLLEMSHKYLNELCIVTLGSLTNLYHAWLLDNTFYNRISQISSMGGVTEPLVINGINLNELNFSCNAKASFNVFTHSKSILVSTGNVCKSTFFSKEKFEMYSKENEFINKLYNDINYWLEREKNVFNHNGMYKWDVFATATLLNPQLFNIDIFKITPSESSLKTGFLIGDGNIIECSIPTVKNIEVYENHVYDTYKNFSIL